MAASAKDRKGGKPTRCDSTASTSTFYGEEGSASYSDDEHADSKPTVEAFDDEGKVIKTGGFWTRLFGRGRVDAETLDQKEFQKLSKVRNKERTDFFTHQVQMTGITAEPEFGTGSALVVLSEIPDPSSLIIKFSEVSELPADVQASVGRMGVPIDELNKHIKVLANILTFCDIQRPKRKFFTPTEYEEVTAPGYRRAVACNRHEPSFTKPHTEIFKRMRLHNAKKIYKVASFLGEGAFGGVVQARLSQKVYGPEIKKVAIKFQQLNSRGDQLLIQHEASFMMYCDHPGIVKMHGGLQIRDESWIVMELLSGGTLKQAAAVGSFDEEEIGFVAVKVLEAVQYLHEHKIVHHDLKNMNIMLTAEGNVKLIDFGLAADISNGPVISMCGSPFWMSPEMIKGEFHSYPTDIWSTVVCLLELANKKAPNSENARRALWLTATQGLGENHGLARPEKWSDKFKSFLAAGGTIDTEARATAQQLLDHPFLDEIVNEKHMAQKIRGLFARGGVAASGL